MTKISACLIVKNEEEFLPRCLDSLAGMDEIVVCDTGSQDNTVEVAKSYGAKVIFFDWIDDFSAARNFVKNQASYDWILSIDADEYLSDNAVGKLHELTEQIEDRSAYLSLKGESSYDRHYAIRLFQKNLQWAGKVHEVIVDLPETYSEIQITYGYSPAHDLDPDIDLRILESIEDPNTRESYYLAREYFYRHRWQDAAEVLQRDYIPNATWLPERADAYLMLARCLWQMERGEDARAACLQAINHNAHFREALVFMGEISRPDNRMMWWRMSEFADNRDVLFIRS